MLVAGRRGRSAAIRALGLTTESVVRPIMAAAAGGMGCDVR